MISREDVMRHLGPAAEDAWKVGRALHRLNEAGYIQIIDAMDGTPWPTVIVGLTPSGWRGAGVWPNPETFQREFLQKLTAAAEQISLDEPAKASKVGEAAAVFTGSRERHFRKGGGRAARQGNWPVAWHALAPSFQGRASRER